MGITKFRQTVVAPGFRISRGSGAATASGLGMVGIATAVYDTAGNDSAGVSNKTVAAHPLGVFLPNKAIIKRFWYDVITTFTSATSAATIAYKANAADDLLAAVAINSGTTMHNAGIHGGLAGYPNLGADAAHDTQVEVAALFAATFVKLTAERELTATVAVEALTAGKAVLFVEYVMSA